jgi:SAM-dependent methyltransferase
VQSRQQLRQAMTQRQSISTAEALRRIDDARARVSTDDAFLAEWADNYGRIHRYRLADDLTIVAGIAPPGTSVLEYGSSPPFLTTALREMGYRVTGLDIDPARFAPAIRDLALDVRKVNFEVERLPFEEESFDVVLFNEVFEHLRIDLIFTMTELRRVVKPRGILLLSTPNHRSVIGLWALLWHHRGCHVCPDLFEEYNKLVVYGHMGHVREYTAREVGGFLEKIGWRTERIIYRNRRPSAGASPALRLCGAIERLIGALFPSLRPSFTLVCRRQHARPVSASP